MPRIEEIRENLADDVRYEIEKYLKQKYLLLDTNYEVEEFIMEDDLGLASLTIRMTIGLENPKDELNINSNQFCTDLSSQLMETLGQNYRVQQIDVEAETEDGVDESNTTDLTITIQIEWEVEEDPIEWDIDEMGVSIPAKRFSSGYHLTKSEFARLERIFLAYKGSEYAEEQLDLPQAIGRIFDLIVGSALMEKELELGGLLLIIYDTYINIKTDLDI